MKLVPLILLLLAAQAQAQRTARPITVDSLPVTAAASDSIYFTDVDDTLYVPKDSVGGLSELGSFYTRAFFCNGTDSVYIDLGGHTILDTFPGQHIIFTALQGVDVDPVSGVRIANGTMAFVRDSSVAGGLEKYVFYGFNVGDVRLDSVSLVTDGQDGLCGWFERIHDDCYVYRGTSTNNSTEYLSRGEFLNGGWVVGGRAIYGTPDSAHVVFLEHDILKTPHQGIAFSSPVDTNGVWLWVEACSIYVDAINWYWDTASCFPGNCGTYNSSANAYAISGYHTGRLIAKYNYIRGGSDDTRRGGQGILLDGPDPDPGPHYIDSNTIIVSSGPYAEGASLGINGNVRGVRIRTIDNLHTDSIYMRGNTIICLLDTSAATSHIGISGSPFSVEWRPTIGPEDMWIQNNEMVCSLLTDLNESDGTPYDEGSLTAIAAANSGTAYTHDNANAPGWIIEDNWWRGGGNSVFCFGDQTSTGSMGNYSIVGDTIELGQYTNYTWRVGEYGFAADSVAVINATYRNGASDSSISFEEENTNSISFMYDAQIFVEDAGGHAVSGAGVVVINSYGDTILADGQTNAAGYDTCRVTYKWFQHPGTDSTAFNPITFTAAYAGDTISDTMSVLPGSTQINLALSQYDAHRVSIIFVHYSVGTQMLEGYCWSGTTPNIIDDLDTMAWTDSTGADTARIVFHSYRMNNEGSTTSLSDTIPGSGENGCAFDYSYYTGFEYRLYEGGLNGRVDILEKNEGTTCPDATCDASILTDFFKGSWSGTDYGKLFETHYVPSRFADSVVEEGGYDLVCIKNPYRCWMDINASQVSLIRGFFQELFDTLENHSEIRFGSAFGTPLLAGHNWTDSTQGKICYGLYRWWADTLVAPANVYKIDTYGPLLEMDEVASRYCLDSALWDGQAGSHINPTGRMAVRPNLLSSFQSAVEDIMDERFGGAGGPADSHKGQNVKGTGISGVVIE